MSYRSLLHTIAADKPIFNFDFAILSAPVRHTFMMATVWYLTQEAPIENMQILEVGSWYGASALSWGQGLELFNQVKGTITCIDAWIPFFDRKTHQNDVYTAMETALSADTVYNIYLHNINTLPKTINCQHLRGKSNHLLNILRKNHFDVVFIDGDHTYTAVKNDIELSLDLVKEGGVICGDDLNLQLHQVDEANARVNAQQDFIQDPKTQRNFHPGVTLAVAECFGKVSSWGGFWAMQKVNQQWKPINLKGMPVHFPNHFPEEAINKAKSHLADLEI